MVVMVFIVKTRGFDEIGWKYTQNVCGPEKSEKP